MPDTQLYASHAGIDLPMINRLTKELVWQSKLNDELVYLSFQVITALFECFVKKIRYMFKGYRLVNYLNTRILDNVIVIIQQPGSNIEASLFVWLKGNKQVIYIRAVFLFYHAA